MSGAERLSRSAEDAEGDEMKKLVSGVLTSAVACLAAVALAGSPAKVSGTVATNGVSLTVPVLPRFTRPGCRRTRRSRIGWQS